MVTRTKILNKMKHKTDHLPLNSFVLMAHAGNIFGEIMGGNGSDRTLNHAEIALTWKTRVDFIVQKKLDAYGKHLLTLPLNQREEFLEQTWDKKTYEEVMKISFLNECLEKDHKCKDCEKYRTGKNVMYRMRGIYRLAKAWKAQKAVNRQILTLSRKKAA